MYSFSYDPELDLWAIIDPDGYTIDHEISEDLAISRVRELNKCST